MADSNIEQAPPRDVVATEGQVASSIVYRHRVVAFVEDELSTAALQTGLEGVEQKLEIRRGTIRNAIRFLERDTDVFAIVVDVAGIEDPMGSLEILARVCPPDVRVCVIGESVELAFYRMLVNGLGVTEYLPKPLTRDTVQTLLRPHLAGNEGESGGFRGGAVIAVCGAQGGAGATSIAVNLAIQLAETTKANVALLDPNLQNGGTALMLGVRPGAGLRIAFEDPMRADALLLERTAIEIEPRLRLLAADEGIDADIQITEAGVRHVLALLRRKFNYIVVDVPALAPATMRPIIAASRHAFVLLQPDIGGLRSARALRARMMEIAGSNRVFTVLNRADMKGGLALPLVTKGLGAPPDVVIPDLGRRMVESVNLGIPAVRRVSALRRHLAPLVREITAIRSEPPRSLLKRLFRR